MRPVIHSVKYYVQSENQTVASGARVSVAIIDAAPAPATTNTFDVQEGAIIRAFFLEIWVKSNASAGTDTKFQLLIEKNPSGGTPATFTQMNNLASYDNKKNILFFSQGVIGDLTTQGIPVVRQWFKVPKSKQRFGLGDRVLFAVSSTAAEINVCGFSTYKEYT